MTVFSAQECIISGIYVHATYKLYGPLYQQGLPKPMVELILVNVLIIFMDLALLGVEYAGLYVIEATMKSLVYAIKLKLEFAVLNDLKGYTSEMQRQLSTVATYCSSCGGRDHFHCGGENKHADLERTSTVRHFNAMHRPSNDSDVPLQTVKSSSTLGPDAIEKTVRLDVASSVAESETRNSAMLPDIPDKRPKVSMFPGVQKPQRAHSSAHPGSGSATPWDDQHSDSSEVGVDRTTLRGKEHYF